MIDIRLANIGDARAIREIYEPYVEDTAVSFEYEVPGIQEFEKRIQNTLLNYPYLVAVENNQIVGYAYAGAFHVREAYRHSAELSVYLEKNHRKSGIGKALYDKLEEYLLLQNVYMVHACIASPDQIDEHLTDDSERFHEKMGFKLAGRHERCGYKFGKWYSMIWMDKVICDRPDNPKAFVPFSNLEESTTAKEM